MASRYNELSGKKWLQYSFSIWRDIRKENGERLYKHPAMFPTQLSSRIIEVFSKKDDLILDPFVGIGSTLISAYGNRRKSIGLELSKEFFLIAKKRIEIAEDELKNSSKYSPKIYCEDARNILEVVEKNSIDLCLTSPPYWDILNMQRSADEKTSRNYGQLKNDLGNIDDYNIFLAELISIFKKVYTTVKINGHCVIILMDIRKKDKFYPFHSDLAQKMEEIGFTFEDIIIWDRQHEYNNMRPLGYPYVFRVNKVHEYLLIFKKRE